jgi:hypothetical protein
MSRMGPIASLWLCADHFRSSPISRHSQSRSARLKGVYLCIVPFIPSRALRLRSYNWPTARESYTRGYSKTDAQPAHDLCRDVWQLHCVHDLRREGAGS